MFQIHILIRDPACGLSWWRAMHPSHSKKPYRYETREQAEEIARMCYPLADQSQIRIIDENEG